MQDPREERKKYGGAEAGDQRDGSGVKEGKDRLRANIHIHDPCAAVHLDFFKRTAVFISAQQPRHGKVDDPCDRGQQYEQQRDRKQHNA